MILLPFCLELKITCLYNNKNLFYVQYCSHLLCYFYNVKIYVFLPWQTFEIMGLYMYTSYTQCIWHLFSSQYRKSRDIDIGINFSTLHWYRLLLTENNFKNFILKSSCLKALLQIHIYEKYTIQNKCELIKHIMYNRRWG